MDNKKLFSQKISCMLWFDNQAEEAVSFYTSLFPNSKAGQKTFYSADDHDTHYHPVKKLMTYDFVLDGHQFIALNGGPKFSVNPSISFYVAYDHEYFIEELWSDLAERGTILIPFEKHELSSKYGKLIDRFDVTWHIALADRPNIEEDRITPLFSFINQQTGKAEDAVNFYTGIFKNSAKNEVLYYTEKDLPEVAGQAKNIHFTLENQHFMASDSSVFHLYDFSEAISFIIHCQNQEEIDYYWEKLSQNGEEQLCGWLKDPYGVSWQIIPDLFFEMLFQKNSVITHEMFKLLEKTKKINIEVLKQLKVKHLH